MAVERFNLDHIPEVHLRGIGQVALSWAILEGVVERVIWRGARLDDNQGLSLTTHMNMPMRLDAMCSIINYVFPDSELDETAKALSGRIRNELSPLRNDVVHTRVIKFPDVEQTVRPKYKARGKLEKQVITIDGGDYKEISNKILKTAHELRQLLSQVIELSTQKYGSPPP